MKALKFLSFFLSAAFLFAMCLSPVSASAKAYPSGTVLQPGFDGLPLRTYHRVNCAEYRTLKAGEQLRVVTDTGEGWYFVEVAGTNETGWVCGENVSK